MKTSRYMWHPAVTCYWAPSLSCGWDDLSLCASSQSWDKKVHYLLQPQGQHKWCIFNMIDPQKLPSPQRAVFVCRVLTLEGNRRWPLHCSHSIDGLLCQQYQHNWIIWNHKHLFLSLWLWSTAGGLSLNSIKHACWCYYGPSFLPAGMSGSCASTETIKVNKISRWVRALRHKWVTRNLLCTTSGTSVRNYPSQVFLQLGIQ